MKRGRAESAHVLWRTDWSAEMGGRRTGLKTYRLKERGSAEGKGAGRKEGAQVLRAYWVMWEMEGAQVWGRVW